VLIVILLFRANIVDCVQTKECRYGVGVSCR